MTTSAQPSDRSHPIIAPASPSGTDAAFEAWKDEYHRQAGELCRQGMARKAESGILPCCAPVGYRNCRKKIEVDPMLGPLVRESFERAATSGLPLRTLLVEMTAKGLVSRSGKPLKIGPFWYMLNNPFYAGAVRWKGKLIRGSHEPLVNGETLEAVQNRLRVQPPV